MNEHLGTTATSLKQLMHQLGVMRYGATPIVVDTFSGGGSIPFEAARIGCSAIATDLNPIACMLSWGASNVIGGSQNSELKWKATQKDVAEKVADRLENLGFEHDVEGNKAKAFLYCLEAKCAETGWMIPLLPTLIISKAQGVVAQLVSNPTSKRYDIEIKSGVKGDALQRAAVGTVQGEYLTHEIDGEVFRTSLKSLRGVERGNTKSLAGKLRLWEKTDVAPRRDDVFQERLYAILWMKKGTETNARPEATSKNSPFQRDQNPIQGY